MNATATDNPAITQLCDSLVSHYTVESVKYDERLGAFALDLVHGEKSYTINVMVAELATITTAELRGRSIEEWQAYSRDDELNDKFFGAISDALLAEYEFADEDMPGIEEATLCRVGNNYSYDVFIGEKFRTEGFCHGEPDESTVTEIMEEYRSYMRGF